MIAAQERGTSRRRAAKSRRPQAWSTFGSWLVLSGACALVAGFPPPHVNEAHYLCKAKHHGDPTFAADDLFLESSDAHWLFATLFGEFSRSVPLPLLAYGGRLAIWFLLSGAWIRLLRVLGLRGWSVPAAGLLLIWLTFATPMAGEWVVGGVEAKGFAFFFGTLALAEVALARWNAAICLAGMATAWHPLVGGWLGLLIVATTVASAGLDWFRRPASWSMLGLAALLAMVGLWPALRLTWGADPTIVRAAAHVYVDIRLGHHLLLQRLDPWHVVRHVAAWSAWALIWWRWAPIDARMQRLGSVVWSSLLLLLGGIFLSGLYLWAPHIAAKWLRFYWFRTPDWLLPVGLAAAGWRVLISTSSEVHRAAWRRWSIVLCVAIPLADIVGGAVTSSAAWRFPPAMRQSRLVAGRRVAWEKVADDWRATCRWIAANTEPGAIFLTPRYQQTFKWYAHRAEVVNWKDVPQDADRLLEWWRRYRRIYPSTFPRRALADHPPHTLRDLAMEYGARYALIDTRRSPEGLPWERIYPARGEDSLFWVYRLPEPSVDR